MDYGSNYTEKRQSILGLRLQRLYKKTQLELEEELKQFTEKKEKRSAELQKQVSEGKIDEQEYKDWLARQVFTEKQWKEKVNTLTDKLNVANDQALSFVRGEQVNVFGENANYQAYEFEKDLKGVISFDIYDETTVEKLLDEQPDLLPRRKTDKNKEKRWNRTNISNTVAQAIIKGESIDKLAKRIAVQTAETNKKAMMRYARTAMTAAQNAGRMETMNRAVEMGIDVMKEWLATLDSRTRDSHRYLDGQRQEVDKPFRSQFGHIRYPGDPTADPADVYNCRCTMIYVYPEYSKYDTDWRQNETVDEMSYNEWKYAKEKASKNITYDDMQAEEAYEHIWLDFVDERSWDEFKGSLTDEQQKAVQSVLDKGKGTMSADLYWDYLANGVNINEELNRMLLDIENGVFKADGNIKEIAERIAGKIAKQEEYEIMIDKAGGSEPSQDYIKAVNERFKYGDIDARKVYLKYIPKGGGVADGNSPISQYENWRKGEKKIVMNYARDAKNINGKGQTWFHEHGHYVDYALGRISKNDDFLKKIISDVTDYEKKYARATNRKVTEEVKDEIGISLTGLKKHGIADIFGAVSNKGFYNLCGTGHDPQYWADRDKYAPASEAFAHMFEAMFDTDERKYMEKYFPSSFQWFKTIIKGAADNV